MKLSKRFAILMITFVFIVCNMFTGVSATVLYFGDIDQSGRVTTSDARAILRHAVQLSVLEGNMLTLADTNQDGRVTSTDARQTLRVAVRLESAQMAPADLVDSPAGALVADAHVELIDSGMQICELRVPKIMLDSAAIDAVNAELWEELYEGDIQMTLEYSVPGQYVMGYSSIDYDWAVNGDILSLWVSKDLTEVYNPEFIVYNISVSELRPLSVAEMIAICGLTQQEYDDVIKDALTQFHYEYFNYDAIYAGESSWMDITFANQQLANTLSDDNLAGAIPYLNADGELCLFCNVYSPGGADCYYHLINIEDYYTGSLTIDME